MLQLVSDRSHQVPVGLIRGDPYPHDPVCAGARHRKQAGTDAVPASAVLHIHDSIGLTDRLDQLSEGRRSVNSLRHDANTSPSVRRRWTTGPDDTLTSPLTRGSSTG